MIPDSGRGTNINFEDYQMEGQLKQAQTSQNRLQQFLPDKNILSKTFWLIIQASPFGFFTYLMTIILEDAAKIIIAGLILFPDDLDKFLGFDIESLDDKTISYNHAITNIIITASFLGTLVFSIICQIFLYRAIKGNEEAEQDALPQIAAKVQTIFLTFFGTFLSIGYQWFIVYTFYFVGYANSTYVPQHLKIIQIILSTFLILFTLLQIFFHDNFYNLVFLNSVLVCGRPSRSTSYVIKPLFIFMLSAFSIKPHMTHLESSLFLLIISTYSTVHLLTSAIARMYYERTLDKGNLLLKVLETAAFITMLLINLFKLPKLSLIIVFIIITPCIYGITILFKSWIDYRIYHKLSHQGVASFKDAGDLEHALYIVMDFLDSEDPIQHARFQGLVISNEERAKDEDQSYFKAIGTIIHMHEKLIEYGSIYEDEEEQQEMKNEEEEQQQVADGSYGKQQQDSDTNEQNSGRASEKKNFKKSTNNKKQTQTQETKGMFNTVSSSIDQSIIGETVNHKLSEIFSNSGDQSTGVRRGQQIMMQKDRNIVKINGIDIDVSNLQQAIKMVKLRYVYEVLVKQATQAHSDEVVFLLIKAFISMDLFHNKYLALTAITHVNVLSQRLSYKEQLISTISMNYFLKTILDKKGNQSQQHTSSTSWISQSLNTQTQVASELDSGLLLEQSLQIDETINYIKMCSYRITQFWQITSSEAVTSEQIASLQEISADISQMLGHIRGYVKQMESIESFQSSCQTLCFYIAHFFTLVIRDKNMGNMIFRQMHLIGMLGRKQQRASLIDEIGVAVVDGNFGLYGKMLFANKIFLKLLGYQTEQINGALIHCLMPSAISEVHNLFWTAFSQMGIPKVLDQLRYLFVKDSKGYVSPYKIFIKFQFSPKYGYSFVGLFRRPTNIMFDEQEQLVKMRKTYQMICNYQGKILEISQSCKDLMKLTPQIIETLHASMQENFLLSFFNPNLVINQMDFSRHSCVQFKNISFNIALLKQFSQTFEFAEENGGDSEGDPFGSIKENFRCQMKIIKETYGSSNSAIVTLYYVIFSEVQGNLDHSGNLTSNQITDSNNIGQPVTKDSSISGVGGGVNESELASFANVNRGSNSENSLMNPTGSLSSTASSSIAGQSEDEIKMVEEGIDYDKVPKPLVFLQLSLTFLFICLIVLASVQYGINRSSEEDNLEYQKLLTKSLQNQELISQLTLMSRTYMNIKTEYEPYQSSFLQDRTTLLRPMALKFIENIRTNLQLLHDFFKKLSSSSDTSGDGILVIDQLNYKNVTMFSLLSNNELSSRKLSRFYSLNMWLVNLYELFIYDNFTSTIGIYTNQNISSQKLTSFDQTLFFILANGQFNLKSQYSIFIETVEQLIDQQVDYALNMNKYYVVITSVLVILLLGMSIYFVVFLLRFKLSLLSFFAEIDRKSMLINAHLAKEFYLFLVTDQKSQLNKCKRTLEEFQQAKLSQLENELQMQNQFALLKELKDKVMKQNQKKGGKNTINAKEVFSVKMKKDEAKKGTMAKSQAVEQQMSDQDGLEDSQESWEEEKGMPGHSYKGHGAKQTIKSSKKDQGRQGRNKKKKKAEEHDTSSSDDEKKMNKDGIFEKSNKEHINSLQASMTVKNKVFAERLQEKMMGDLSKMIILGIITAIVIVAYFVGQLVLITNNELMIKTNSQQIRTMMDSMECTDEFIYQVRKLQISNSSWYQLDDSLVGQKIRFSPTNVEANNLNVTYQSCIKKNQRVDQLLQTYNNGKYQLKTKEQSNQTLCSYIDFNSSYVNGTFNQTSCENAYQGVLGKPILQSTSVFLQDSLYSAIRFMSPQIRSQRNETFIRSQVASKTFIELVDVHTFCLQNGLRRFYSHVIDQIMASLDFSVLTALFILFISILVFAFFILQIFVMKKVKVAFWHSFFILRLIPKDDMNRDFIKRINDYLGQA